MRFDAGRESHSRLTRSRKSKRKENKLRVESLDASWMGFCGCRELGELLCGGVFQLFRISHAVPGQNVGIWELWPSRSLIGDQLVSGSQFLSLWKHLKLFISLLAASSIEYFLTVFEFCYLENMDLLISERYHITFLSKSTLDFQFFDQNSNFLERSSWLNSKPALTQKQNSHQHCPKAINNLFLPLCFASISSTSG